MRLSAGFGLLGVVIAVLGVVAVNGNRVAPYLVIAAGVALVFLAVWVQVRAEEIKLAYLNEPDTTPVVMSKTDPVISTAVAAAQRTGAPVAFTVTPMISLSIDSADLSKPMEEEEIYVEQEPGGDVIPQDVWSARILVLIDEQDSTATEEKFRALANMRVSSDSESDRARWTGSK